MLMPKPSESPPQFCQYDETARGYHLWQSQDDNRTSPIEITNKKG